MKTKQAIKELCETQQEIVAALYGQVMSETQVRSLIERLDKVKAAAGKTTSQPKSGSPSTTPSPHSKRKVSTECVKRGSCAKRPGDMKYGGKSK